MQILTGPSLNETVVTGGAYGLDDGTKVKVGAADDDSNPSADKTDKDAK